jgi:O-antigen/teichoic acid export membrane protein
MTDGSAASQALTIIAFPIITWLYSPAHYGSWSLLLSVFVILFVVVCWRYEFAILLPKEDDEAANIFGLSVLLAIGMTSLTVLVFGISVGQLRGLSVLRTTLTGCGAYLYCF